MIAAICVARLSIFLATVILISADCGTRTTKSESHLLRIVGGKTASPYSWPWQVSIFKYSWFSGYQHWCGGSLIANQWIMTAGHCVASDIFPSKYRIKLGVHNKVSNGEGGEVVSPIEAIYLHPKYDSETTEYDVALMKLPRPVSYTEHIAPVCLPYPNELLPKPGTNVVVTGWGLIKAGGSDSATLQEVTIPLVGSSICSMTYPGAIDQSTMFCAGPLTGGKDSCNGDSGGPLVYQDPKTNRWEQLGIVSWGDEVCAKALRPGVYSKVSAFVDWIRKYAPIGH